jgi:hypothetical protein
LAREADRSRLGGEGLAKSISLPAGESGYAAFMGDKSPKAKDKSKKQDAANKDHKKAAATAKASSNSAPKKTK